MNGKRWVTTCGRRIKCIQFADDMTVLTESEAKLIEMLDGFSKSYENLKKLTKDIILSGKSKKINISHGNEVLE